MGGREGGSVGERERVEVRNIAFYISYTQSCKIEVQVACKATD